MRTIGLTGGIGSGKSTVARMLADHGAVIIDADALSRNLTQAGGAAMAAICQAFGTTMMAQDGSLNRAMMRHVVLRDGDAKARLEAIIHPLVGQQIDARLCEARRAGASVAVVDLPLLAEGGARWRSRFDAVWVVDCLPASQIKRVQERSGWTVAQIEAAMAAQASRAQRLACADAVIHNEGLSLTQLKGQVHALLKLQTWQC